MHQTEFSALMGQPKHVNCLTKGITITFTGAVAKRKLPEVTNSPAKSHIRTHVLKYGTPTLGSSVFSDPKKFTLHLLNIFPTRGK